MEELPAVVRWNKPKQRAEFGEQGSDLSRVGYLYLGEGLLEVDLMVILVADGGI